MLAVAVAVLPGCGSDGGGDSSGSADTEHDVVAAIDSLNGARDAESYCAQLTDAGRTYVAKNFAEGGPANSCEQAFGPAEAATPPAKLPKVDPVGVEGDFAIAVVQFGGEYDESLIYTLKREDGKWLIECPCTIPDPSQLVSDDDASGDAQDFINSPEGLSAAGQEDTDGDFNPVVAVGDVALAYQRGGASAPTLLVNDGNGWRVAPISVGVP